MHSPPRASNSRPAATAGEAGGLPGGGAGEPRRDPRPVTEGSGSLAAGREVVAGLRAQCHKPAVLPGTLGRPRPELRSDIRRFPYRNHVIYFRSDAGTFEVVNILHARRDVTDHFAPSQEP